MTLESHRYVIVNPREILQTVLKGGECWETLATELFNVLNLSAILNSDIDN